MTHATVFARQEAALDVKHDAGSASQLLPRHTDEWYLPTEDESCRLFVREYGTGPTVVVLHGGWGAEHSYLLDAIAPHVESYHFVLYDQRGSMRSKAPLRSISVEQHVEDLELLRRTLDLEEMPLLAHSMGTFLAMSYLENYPERVGNLILTGAVPAVNEGRMLEDMQSHGTLMMERAKVQEVLEAEGLTAEKLTPRQQTHAWRVRFASVNLFHLERWSQLGGGQIFYSSSAGDQAASTMRQTWDFTDLLAEHPCQVTVILGDHDYVDWQAEKWKATAKHLPEARVHILKNAGHSVWIDQPDQFEKAVAEGLKE